MEINYEKMRDDYNKNLETNLRGFTGGPPPFETWTPTEGDPKRSVLDLIDLAVEDGQDVIFIKVSGEEKFAGGYNGGFICVMDDGVQYVTSRGVPILLEFESIAHVINPSAKVVNLKRNLMTIDYTDMPGKPPFHYSLIKIEDELCEKYGHRIYLQTLNIDDKNKRDKK